MKDCTPAGDCHFNKFRRPLYFHGMLVDEKSFHDEQEYHAQKRRLLNRMLYGSGVVCGLHFTDSTQNTITISCGLALDCAGCEIYVPCDVSVKVPVPKDQPKDPCAPKVRGQEICYRIRISCTEEDTDFEQVRLPGGGCDDKTCKPTRKREGFCITFDECGCPPQQRTSALCAEFIETLKDPVKCGCGCGCSCEAGHGVSLGTVRVKVDGTIIGKPTYDCRDYVFSAHMFKQLMTSPKAQSGDCACPDQWERLRDLLTLVCKTQEENTKLRREVNDHAQTIQQMQAQGGSAPNPVP